MVLLFEPQADLVTGQALFVNSFPLSLVVLLNSLLLPAELGAGWKFPANGPPGQPRKPDYQAQPISIRLMLAGSNFAIGQRFTHDCRCEPYRLSWSICAAQLQQCIEWAEFVMSLASYSTN